MKRVAVALLVLASSTASAEPDPGLVAKPEEPEEPEVTRDRFVEAVRAHDAKAIAKLLHGNVLVRGLWFPDAGCAKRFAKERTLTKKDHAAFAACLAKLGPQTSTRRPGDSVAQLFTYAPGVEIQLGFADGQLYYASNPYVKASPVPALTAQAFEALRKTGTTNVDKLLASTLGAPGRRPVAAWLEVCLDAKGAAKITVAEASSPAVGAAMLAAASDWTFNPFVHGKTAVPACSQSLLTYPAANAPKVEVLPRWEIPQVWDVDGEDVEGGVAGGVESEWLPGVGWTGNAPLPPPPPPPPPRASVPQNVPPTLLEQERTAGTKLIIPDATTLTAIQRSGKDKVIGSWKLCLDATGAITTVTALKTTGFPDYDAKIEREIRATWKYKPYRANGSAIPVCTAVTFIYNTTPASTTP